MEGYVGCWRGYEGDTWEIRGAMQENLCVCRMLLVEFPHTNAAFDEEVSCPSQRTR